MELWIRSQDRWELHKAEHIRMRMEREYFNIECGITVIGTYKTRERALEVLDEIQRYILLPNTDNSAYVYEMPQE